MRTFHRLLLGLAALSLVACDDPKGSGPDATPPPALADIESRVISSKVTGRDYQVTVALPRGYAKSSVDYPVLYMVDANGQFGSVVEAARLFRFDVLVPELLIVGVGYPVGRMWNAQPPRAVDLTPTSDPQWVSQSAIPEIDYPRVEGSGGGAGFLRFFLEELIPAVESEYRTNSMDRALYGHSFGGLFGAYALFQSDGAFQRFIIGSPSLWWDDRTIFEIESEYSESRNDLSARVFLSVGQLEPEEPYRMVTNFQEFISILERRDYDGFDLEWWIFEDETHNSVIPPTISRGLRSIYKDRQDDGT